ncbi:MAG: hypothetical protein ACRD4E_06215 [Bryobacteraceae bacterium]
MHSARIAEWILSLVTTPEGASAAVGDLMEGRSIGGPFRFWLGILRTAFSMLWREFSDEPARMMSLAIRGLLLQFGFLFGSLLIFVIGFGFLGGIIALLWHPTKATDPLPFARALGTMMGIVFAIFAPFQVGRWMARRSPGQELAACLALTLFTAAVDVISLASGMETVPQLMRSIILPLIPTFAGAVWVRKNSPQDETS